MIIVFALAVSLLLHTYLIYPLLLNILAKNKKSNGIVFSESDEDLPSVSILFAAYNEQNAIKEKILSTIQTEYPLDKIEILIGSDASTDDTNLIIIELAKKFPQIRFYPFENRSGKAKIINTLYDETNYSILIFTDAKVFFTPSTIFELVKHLKNPKIQMVGGNLVNKKFHSNGVSVQENTYMNMEMRMKYQEGILWGTVAGVFGACYAIRKECYNPIPKNFVVDDFYVTMKVLEKGGHVINEINAICYENLASGLKEEFRRKVRISSGNFQNLRYFAKLLFSKRQGLSFSYISHKVLRWIGPLMIILCFFSGIYLAFYYNIFIYIAILQAFTFSIPLFDWILSKIQIHIKLFRYITHFYSMNIALMMGFFKYIRGIKSNVWQPSIRK